MFPEIKLNNPLNKISIFTFSPDMSRFKTIQHHLNASSSIKRSSHISDLVTLCNLEPTKSDSLLIMDLIASDLPLDCYQFVFNKFINVVLISDQAEHAVWAFEFGAVDFILYPFNADRLHLALQKIKNPDVINLNRSESSSIFIKHSRDLIKLTLREIIYIQAMGNYIRIHMDNNKCITSLEKISFIQHRLPAHQFTRVHKSYIINNDFIKSYDKREVLLQNEISLPLSITYRHLLSGQYKTASNNAF